MLCVLGDLVELLTPMIRTAVLGESYAEYMYSQELNEEEKGRKRG